MKKGDIEAEKVRTMPDFIVMDEEGDVSFVEVKFRSNGILDDKNKSLISKIAECWPETRLIFVTPQEPYFLISRVKDLKRTGKLYPLEKERWEKHVVGAMKGFQDNRYSLENNEKLIRDLNSNLGLKKYVNELKQEYGELVKKIGEMKGVLEPR